MIFVTGGKGFIGSNFVRRLIAMGSDEEIFILDNDSYAANHENIVDLLNGIRDEEGNYLPSKVEFVNVDIANEEKVKHLFDVYEPEVIINFAAHTHVDRSIDNDREFFRSNVEGVRVLLKCVNELNSKKKRKFCRMVQISTDEVYGSNYSNQRTPVCYEFAPGNPYAASKAAAELLCLSYRNTFDTPVTIISFTNVFGPRQHKEKFIPTVIQAFKNDSYAPIYGTGKQVRQWIYIDEVTLRLCKYLRDLRSPGESFCKIPNKTHFAGNYKQYTNLELAHIIGTLMNKPIKLMLTQDRPGHDFRYYIEDTEDFSLRFDEGKGFEEALKETIRWYQNR